MFNFVVIDRRNDRCHQCTHRNSGCMQSTYGMQPCRCGGSTRLEDALQVRIKRSHTDMDGGEIVAGHRRKNIDVALNEMPLGDDRHRMSKLLQHLENRSGHLELA